MDENVTMDDKKRILFLHPSADRYGQDVVLLDLVRGLDRTRWSPVVAVPSDGPLVPLLLTAGAQVEFGPLGVLDRRSLRSPVRLLRFAINLPRAISFVRRLVKRHAPALIHTNTSIVVGGALGATLSGARHLWHLHEIVGQPEWATRVFARAAARLADVVVSNSIATRGSYDRYSPELAARHRVVLNGIDAERLSPQEIDRDAARAELEVPEHAPLVLLVGRVNSWKGQRLLIDAAERLRFRHPDAQFLLVGDAPPGQGRLVVELKQEIQRRNLVGYVRHLPHQVDVGRLYVAADIVVVPSTRPEPFGLVAAEAMACARPVIAADHGGVTEVVEAGLTGLLFEPGDAEKLAWALQVLIEDRARAREMGRMGQVRQRALFTRERMILAMDRVWSQLIARPFDLPAREATLVHVVLGKANPARMNDVNQVVHQLATEQAARGLDVTVFGVTPEPDAPTPPRTYALQLFQARRLPLGLDSELTRALNALPPTTVVHMHGGLHQVMRSVSRALVRRRIPYVLTPYGSYNALALQRSPWYERLYLRWHERPFLRKARAIQAFSPREREDVLRVVGSGPDAPRVAIIPTGQAVLQDTLPRDTDGTRRPLFGFCGRLASFAKGLDTLIDAFAMHAASGGEGTLWLIGDGEDRAALEARAAELGIARRVVFLGALFGAEKLAHLAALDVLMQPSRHEGMPIAVLEAAALGRAVVVTEATNLDVAVREAGAGFVLKGSDPEHLAATLSACEREWSEGTLTSRGEAANAMIDAHFAWRHLEPALRRDLYGLDDGHELADVDNVPGDAQRQSA